MSKDCYHKVDLLIIAILLQQTFLLSKTGSIIPFHLHYTCEVVTVNLKLGIKIRSSCALPICEFEEVVNISFGNVPTQYAASTASDRTVKFA